MALLQLALVRLEGRTLRERPIAATLQARCSQTGTEMESVRQGWRVAALLT
jgi:hypothetical protein